MPDDLTSLNGRDFIEGEVFVDVDGKDAVIAHKELYRCTFRGGSLERARFERITFEACVFEIVILRGSPCPTVPRAGCALSAANCWACTSRP